MGIKNEILKLIAYSRKEGAEYPCLGLGSCIGLCLYTYVYIAVSISLSLYTYISTYICVFQLIKNFWEVFGLAISAHMWN